MKKLEDESFRKVLEETLPLGRNVRILAANAAGIFALEKPTGILTHPNESGLSAAKKSLFLADYSLKNECYACRVAGGKIQKIYVLNRLDSPTSGVVLVATDEKLALAVRRAFLAGAVRKVYHALVFGNPVPATGVWKNFLRRTRSRDGSLRVEECRENARDALFAETAYAVERTGTFSFGDDRAVAGALLRLEPKTGRTHQLRVQCALRKMPILGDKTYGDFHLNSRVSESGVSGVANRLFLHAAETEIVLPWRGRKLDFSAKSSLPPVFSEIFQGKK